MLSGNFVNLIIGFHHSKYTNTSDTSTNVKSPGSPYDTPWTPH